MADVYRVLIQNKTEAHQALRRILSGYLNLKPEEINFEISPTGKPTHPKLFFSLSHSQNLALIAVSKEQPVGIDVEFVRPVPNKRLIIQRFFAPSEQHYLEQFEPDQQDLAFFKIWTAKEALSKLKGARLLDELGIETVWKQVEALQGIDQFVAHLAFQTSFARLDPVHVFDFHIQCFAG